MKPFVQPQEQLCREIRHRNNAAEWCLWALLFPFVSIVWMIDRVKRR